MSVDQSSDILARLLERVDGRYYGKYRGTITNNADPSNLGRIRATVPRLLGTQQSGWALPAFGFGGVDGQGAFAIPEVGAGVWIEFEEGDLSYPVWTGCWYPANALPAQAAVAVKVFKTASGHAIALDDAGKTLVVTDANGNAISLGADTISIKAGKATKIVLDAPNIALVDGAAHPLVLGDVLQQYLTGLVQAYQSHTHPGQSAPPGGGPVTPTPPVPPMSPPPANLNSTQVKTT